VNAPAQKKILQTPIRDEDLADLKVGDVVYLTGRLVTCRDVAHRRLIEQGRALPVNLEGGATFHAGPIVRKKDDGKYEMVSIGPTTSMRMEKFEREFIQQTGVKLIVGKGGMGPETAAGCQEHKAVHAIFPGGCAVLAATQVEEIEGYEWQDLGMPETLWINRVREFGPLIISIDTHGNNLIAQNKTVFNEKKKPILAKISEQLSFIK
jgi:L(+)-tartrate dehydratase beta subunit